MTEDTRSKVLAWQSSALVLAALLISTTAFAQDCAPGPLCAQTGKNAERYTARKQAGMGTDVLDNAKIAWCVYQVTAELSRVCGDEMAREGRSNCSEQWYQQKATLLENAERAIQNARDSYTDIGSNWDRYCRE